MYKKLFVALLMTGALAAAAEPLFAIPNALRPGGNAPHCPAKGETPDGCIFHTLTDDVNQVRLPLTADTRWSVHTADAGLVSIRQTGGAHYQTIDIIATAPEDADISVSFDKLTSADGPLRVIERRRVFLMKHSQKSWNE